MSATDLDDGLNGQVLYQLLTTGPAQSVATTFSINAFSESHRVGHVAFCVLGWH